VRQRTIAAEARLSGVGLHTGNPCNLTFRPAPPGSGILFVRTDLPGRPAVPADVAHVVGLERGTSLGRDGVKVHTVEHVLAAAAALRIDNLLIELDANEPPVGDGSALPFFLSLKSAGVVEQNGERAVFTLERPLHFERDGVRFTLVPSDRFQVTFSIDFDHPVIGHQYASFEITPEVFERELAPARTFGFLHEIERLKEQGLIRGGTLENAIVVGDREILNRERLRFPDEFVRHKILDLIGDLSLFGREIRAHVISSKSGHKTNVDLVNELVALTGRGNGGTAAAAAAPPAARAGRAARDGTGAGPAGPRPGRNGGAGPGAARFRPRTAPFGADDVLRILPHRFPFLLVDRVLELEPEKRIVGIKNVTLNEPFFSGHFPGRPIMPGVLLVEAMGQVGGLLLMNSFDEPERKLVFFVGLDDVRFRRPVVPGDTLRIEMTLVRLRGRTCRMTGTATVDGARVAEATLTAVVVDREPQESRP
jgi:UDP-3-O-[3-hydroxymyristoyl] N-acetylglucosamine deacetylase/3-hydroxyacyl-[acyl-carrier-protein] dehydratase